MVFLTVIMYRHGVLEGITEQSVPAEDRGISCPTSWFAVATPDTVQNFQSRSEANFVFSHSSAAILVDVLRYSIYY